MQLDHLGRVGRVVVRLLFRAHVQRLDPVGRQRMALEERILVGVVEHFLVAELVEEIDQPLG